MKPKVYTELFTETENGVMYIEAYWNCINYDSFLMPLMSLDTANEGYDVAAIVIEETPTLDENGHVALLSANLSPLTTGNMVVKVYSGGRDREYRMLFIVTLEVNGKQVFSFDSNRYFTLSPLSDSTQAGIIFHAVLAVTYQSEDDYETGAYADWFDSYECEALASMGSDLGEKFGLD